MTLPVTLKRNIPGFCQRVKGWQKPCRNENCGGTLALIHLRGTGQSRFMTWCEACKTSKTLGFTKPRLDTDLDLAGMCYG